MNCRNFIPIICLFVIASYGQVAAQQDSLLGFASINEAYRSISMERGKLAVDKSFIEPLEIETIQKEVLADGQALLEYFISDSKVCVFFISKTDFKKEVILKDFPLEKWVNLLVANLENPDFNAANFEQRNQVFVETSNLIYEKIFAPLEKFNLPEQLLIKPDGILKQLPFEIFLVDQPSDLLDFENHDYLFQKYKISYCHSTMTQQQARKKKELAPKLFLTFAPTEQENIQDEAIAIYRKFGGDIYQTGLATSTILKTESSLFQAIHFPAICEETIANLPILNTKMVHFSNCKKEENSHLAVQQFFKKGTQSVVTNLWETTPENRLDFLKNFYHHIYQKKDKDAAMQRAKKDALRWTSGVEGHPHFWASQVVFGNVENVDLQGIRFDLFLWGGLVLMLFFGVIFINKNVI